MEVVCNQLTLKEHNFYSSLELDTELETELDTKLSKPRKAWALEGHPSEAPALTKLRRYHTRPNRFNWGPENVHFGKTYFRDPNIATRIFLPLTKF